MKRLMQSIKFYERCHKKRPLMTVMISSGILAGIGDIICQNLEKSLNPDKKKFDYYRLLCLSAHSFCLGGPYLHFTYTRIIPYIGVGQAPVV